VQVRGCPDVGSKGLGQRHTPSLHMLPAAVHPQWGPNPPVSYPRLCGRANLTNTCHLALGHNFCRGTGHVKVRSGPTPGHLLVPRPYPWFPPPISMRFWTLPNGLGRLECSGRVRTIRIGHKAGGKHSGAQKWLRGIPTHIQTATGLQPGVSASRGLRARLGPSGGTSRLPTAAGFANPKPLPA